MRRSLIPQQDGWIKRAYWFVRGRTKSGARHLIQRRNQLRRGNKGIERAAKPTLGRTGCFPGIALTIDELQSQIVMERGGPLLARLQSACLDIPNDLSLAGERLHADDVFAMAMQNLVGGRRRDLPLTVLEAREIIFKSLFLTQSFGREPELFIGAVIDRFQSSSLLMPFTKEDTLVLVEALQCAGRLQAAQIAISDGFGRYGPDGDREMMCLQANNALYLERAGAISLQQREAIRTRHMQELFGKLPTPAFSVPLAIDRIQTESRWLTSKFNPLVSVILTVYNGAATLGYALQSIQQQTWRNLEIIAIDDGSNDDTFAILQKAAETDPRVHIFRNEKSLGAYASRNVAVQHARGEAITCHDADDWSHPSKIERQMRLLNQNKHFVACASAWIRVTHELEFTRKSRHLRYVQQNPSSLLFRRSALARVALWDEVSVGADSEYQDRLRAIYGVHNVKYLNEVLSFGLDRNDSLSKQVVWRGWLSDDLETYHRAFMYWHRILRGRKQRGAYVKVKSSSDNGFRPFPVPAALRGKAPENDYDVLLVSDFRLHGGSTLSLAEEIRAQHQAGMRTAIFQVNAVLENVTGRKALNEKIEALLHAGACVMVGADQAIRAKVCVMRFPPIFEFTAPKLPNITADAFVFVVNTAPVELGGDGRTYHIENVQKHLDAALHPQIQWHPIGPRIRDYIAPDLPEGTLSAQDWVNIIDVEDWRVERSGFVSTVPVVGRHSRDDKVKWPVEKDVIQKVYFNDPHWRVRFMGGANAAVNVYGPLPGNAEVLAFNKVPVRRFLKSLDFFVYYDDPDRVEAFGRVFIEAIVAGCCVILPKYYEPVFGDACLYAEPEEVKNIVNRMYADKEAFLSFTRRAQDIAARTWSYQTHVDRIRALQDGARESVPDGGSTTEGSQIAGFGENVST